LAPPRFGGISDTHEAVAIPRAKRLAPRQGQETREHAVHHSDAALGVVADGRDMERVVAHPSRGDERRRLQLLALDRTHFDIPEHCHAILLVFPEP
jgi:hypothetical protein